MPGGGSLKVYDDSFKYEVLRTYVDLKHSLQEASEKHSIPKQTLHTWLRKPWARAYVREYEVKVRDIKSQQVIKTIDEAKVESLVSDYQFNTNANLILSMIEDRVIELIPKTKSIKDLTGIYKVVADIKLKLLGVQTEKDGNEKRNMIINLIDKQMNVSPVQIRDLLAQINKNK